MPLPPDFGVTLTSSEFEERFIALHQQLFASTPYQFDDVTTHVYRPPVGLFQVDHSFIHDGELWHLFYATGEMKNSEAYIDALHRLDFEAASQVAIDRAQAHAVGPTPGELQFHEEFELPSQGRFDMIARGVCSVFRRADCGSSTYGMLHDVKGDNGRGELFIGMSVAWSDDLSNWVQDEANPMLQAPGWTVRGSTFKDSHVMYHEGVYLIYCVVMDQSGLCTVALWTTRDWKTFEDEGPVFQCPPQLRGTIGIESPQVIERDGIWHLFFTYGTGLQHAISLSPTSFFGARDSFWKVGTGFYNLGPFHATEVIRQGDQWWLSTDRKEETRRLNREAGRLCYRGTYADEKTLEEGLYLSEIIWKGDQPTLGQPAGKDSSVPTC